MIVVVQPRRDRSAFSKSARIARGTGIDDLPGVAQRVGAGVDERLVFQVLVLMANDRIDRQERAFDRAAAFVDDLVDVGEILLRERRRIVEQRVRPERRR